MEYERRYILKTLPPMGDPVEIRRYTQAPPINELRAAASIAPYPCELVPIRIPAHSVATRRKKPSRAKPAPAAFALI